jgi:excisionase family DNA binding protein
MPVTVNNKSLYSVSEVAEAMGLTNQTVRLYIRSGKLEAERIGRAYLISEEAVLDYVKRSKEKEDPNDWGLEGDNTWGIETDWKLEEQDSTWDIKTDWDTPSE